MNCRDFREIIDSYLSDELLTETNHDVLRHLEDCADCRKVIEVRREVRSRLKSAVINAPQYQIGKNFTHNLNTHLKFEALKMQDSETTSYFGFGSWIAVAAGLILTFTLGFFLLNSFNNDQTAVVAEEIYTTNEFPENNLVNIAFGDHQFCAVKHDSKASVKFVATPAKFENIEQIAMPQIQNILRDYKLKEFHSCQYRNTDFTHLVVEKDNKILSVMMTDKNKAGKFNKDMNFSSSAKYQMARFDIDNTAVFVISDLNQQINTQVAKALYDPLRRHLAGEKTFQTAMLVLK